MIKILLVDDHEVVRMGLRRLLADVPDFRVIAEASSGEEAVKKIREEQPDVVLMDVKMPGIGGLEATRKIVRSFPDIKVINVTACDEEPFPTRLLQAGAVGYVTKDQSIEEIIKAVRTVFSGQRYISADVAQSLALRHVTDQEKSPFDSLSERELQVMLMITAGQKVQDISEKLHLSPKTVNSYRYRIFEKLKINTDVELTHMAIAYGVIDANIAERE